MVDRADVRRRGALARDWRPLGVAIVAGGAVGPALLTAGLVDTPAATASLLLNMELVATVILAATLFREHLGRNMIAAASLVTFAGLLLVWEPGATINLQALLIVGACACWGLDNSVTAGIDQISPQHVVFLKGVVAGSVNLALGLALTGIGSVTAWTVLAALAIGALGYGASITLWVRGAQQLGAARGQVIFASAPFVGAVLAWVVLSDPIEVVQVVAMLIAAVGVGLSLWSAHEHPHRHEHIEHTHEHEHTDGHHDHTTPMVSSDDTVTSTNTINSCTRTHTSRTSTTDTTIDRPSIDEDCIRYSVSRVVTAALPTRTGARGTKR